MSASLSRGGLFSFLAWCSVISHRNLRALPLLVIQTFPSLQLLPFCLLILILILLLILLLQNSDARHPSGRWRLLIIIPQHYPLHHDGLPPQALFLALDVDISSAHAIDSRPRPSLPSASPFCTPCPPFSLCRCCCCSAPSTTCSAAIRALVSVRLTFDFVFSVAQTTPSVQRPRRAVAARYAPISTSVSRLQLPPAARWHPCRHAIFRR